MIIMFINIIYYFTVTDRILFTRNLKGDRRDMKVGPKIDLFISLRNLCTNLRSRCKKKNLD